MLASIVLASSTLAVFLVFAWVYESRRRIAIQTLLRRLLSHGRNNETILLCVLLIALIVLIGCGDHDARVAEMAREQADLQAAQRQQMARLQQEVSVEAMSASSVRFPTAPFN